jgi:hypothetical protein
MRTRSRLGAAEEVIEQDGLPRSWRCRRHLISAADNQLNVAHRHDGANWQVGDTDVPVVFVSGNDAPKA